MSVSERAVLWLPQGDDAGSAGENDSLRTTQPVTGPEEKVQAPHGHSTPPFKKPTGGGGVAIAWATLRFPCWVRFDAHTIQFWTWKMSLGQRNYSLQRPLPFLCPCPVARPGAGQARRGSLEGQKCGGLGGQAVCPEACSFQPVCRALPPCAPAKPASQLCLPHAPLAGTSCYSMQAGVPRLERAVCLPRAARWGGGSEAVTGCLLRKGFL